MISETKLRERRAQLDYQRAELVSAIERITQQHRQVEDQLNAVLGAIQECDAHLAEPDDPPAAEGQAE